MTTHESQIGLALISEHCSSHYKKAFKSLRSVPSTDAIFFIDEDDDGEEVSSYLEPNNDSELSSVVNGLLKSKDDDDDAPYRVDWLFLSADLHEKETEKKNKDERSLSTSLESAMVISV